MIDRRKLNYVVIGVVTVVIFLALMQTAQSYSEFLQNIIQQAGTLGIISYIALMIVSVVVAPVSFAFLLPIAANGWGPLAAAVYSIVGWTIGSMIAFFLARRYGLAWAEKFTTVKKMRLIEESIPRHHVFWFVVVLRVALPVDILSYTLGIFSSIRYGAFFWSTLIGISFFAFLFSYASVSSVELQIFTVLLGLGAFLTVMHYIFFRKTPFSQEEPNEEQTKN